MIIHTNNSLNNCFLDDQLVSYANPIVGDASPIVGHVSPTVGDASPIVGVL